MGFVFGPANTQSIPNKLDTSLKGANNGLAELDATGKVPTSQLPSTLPSVTSSDNGKVLKVVEGEWDAAEAPSGLPSVTASDNGKSLDVINSEWAVGNKKVDKNYDGFSGSTLTAKTWSGLTSFLGNKIWTVGDNIYYSNGYTQKVLDKSTSTWNTKTWTGLYSFNGENIWLDGDNIYYSEYDNQYILNASTLTWSQKSWSGTTSIVGSKVWTDGENFYYSDGSTQRKLNKSTSTWSSQSWTGLTSFSGANVWTDGENIYCSEGAGKQYVLDVSTSAWSAKTWNSYAQVYGEYIWTNGINIYYSQNGLQYILDKSTSTWSTTTWTGLSYLNGPFIWTDGKTYYYSSNTSQYEFQKEYENKLLFGSNGEFSPVPIAEIISNSLSDTSTDKALSAAKGKELSDGKLDKANVVNNLTTTAEGYALDARQGKVISDQIGTLNSKIATTELSSSLLTAVSGYTLSNVRLTKSGNIVTISASVSGTINADVTTVAKISNQVVNNIRAFGGARYGVSGSFVLAGSAMLLENRSIRIQGNHTTVGDFADFTIVVAV